MECFHVIIPAAGIGSRMGEAIPKQYLSLNGKTLVEHVISVFSHSLKISSIHLILSEGDQYWKSLNVDLNKKVSVYYCGGETRSATVLNGLSAIGNLVNVDDWILVHDAARPGLSDDLLNRLLITLEEDAVGGLLALPLTDTLKRSNSEERVEETLPRSDLWQAQTPQMFRYGLLKKALTNFKGIPTDESEAIEALGQKPKLIRGELRNLKVTFPQDLIVLSALVNE